MNNSPPSLSSTALRAIVLAIIRAKLRWRRLEQFKEDSRHSVLQWNGIGDGMKTIILDTLEEAIGELNRWSQFFKTNGPNSEF